VQTLLRDNNFGNNLSVPPPAVEKAGESELSTTGGLGAILRTAMLLLYMNVCTRSSSALLPGKALRHTE
jgi:hypothetical protein